MKHFDEKWLLRGKLQNLGFLGFFWKNLKVKNAYLGGFSVKIEKNEYVFGKEMKSLLYKSTLIFFLGGSEKELRAHLYFFGDTPSGPIAQS